MLVWLERWTSDNRVNGQQPVDMWWRNVYMSVYGALGLFQGKLNYFLTSEL